MAPIFADNFKGGGFGGLVGHSPDFDGSRAAILPVPYDGAVSYKSGAREGPGAIIEASCHVELYDTQWNVDNERLKLTLLNEVEPDVSGPEETIAKVETVYGAAFDKTGFVLMLGGDHSLTTAPVRSLARRFKEALTIVQIDAHTDLRDTYQGSPFSHACVMRRAIELAPIVQIGVRSMSKVESDFIKDSGHPVYPAWDVAGKTDWIEPMVDALTENVYITFDLDGFDPSVVPGVGTPEPGGLSWDDAMNIIHAIGSRRKIVGADVMELRPIPGSVQSQFTAAKLCFKLLSAALSL
ncbi:Agmatinase [hydrothermal vent metagenome]|uniref:Agmatinase n=1 Tax=hydrothermal vent metagenome TaxID=652676 RepID=A0A3B1CPN0_9ZZZZ